MLGVLTDHDMRCYSNAAFCTVLARDAVRPWTEMLVRSFGTHVNEAIVDQCEQRITHEARTTWSSIGLASSKP